MAGATDPTWELSPEKLLHLPGHEDSFNSSPTRVLDFEDVWGEDEEKVPDEEEDLKSLDKNSAERDSIFRRLASPDLTIPPPPPYKPPRRRSEGGALPTLKEVSSASFETAEERGVVQLFPSGYPDFKPGAHLPRKGAKPTIKGTKQPVKKSPVPSGKPKTHFEKVEKITKRASGFADRGSEEDAIKMYRKALGANASELSRIKYLLTEADSKHPSTVESIQLRLHEDWLSITLSIGKIRTNMAVLHERLGQYTKAISCCEEAVRTYERHPDLKGLGQDKGTLIKLVESTNETLEKFRLGESTFAERKEKHQEISRLRIEAAASGDKETLKKAEVLAMEIKGVETASLGTDHPQIASTCTELSEIATALGDPDRAISYSGEALRINEIVLGDKHTSTGNSLVHIARLYAKNSDDDDAVEMYTRALEFFRSAKAPPKIIGSLLHEVALIAMRNGHFQVAIRCLNDALDLYQARSKSKPPREEMDLDVISDIAVLWCGLGRCCFQCRRFDESVVALANMLDLQRDLRRIHEAATAGQSGDLATHRPFPALATDESIAGTLRRLGRAFGCSNKHAEARAVWKEAIMISKIAVARIVTGSKGRLDPLLPAKEDELAADLFNYGKACFDSGDYKKAHNFYGESLQLRLFSDAHKPEGKRTNMGHCAMCLVGLGNIHVMKGELSEAQKVYEDARGYCRAQDIPKEHSICQMIDSKLREVESILSIKVDDDDDAPSINFPSVTL